MSLSDSNNKFFQSVADWAWGDYFSGELSNAFGNSKFKEFGQLGLGLFQNYFNHFMGGPWINKSKNSDPTTKTVTSVNGSPATTPYVSNITNSINTSKLNTDVMLSTVSDPTLSSIGKDNVSSNFNMMRQNISDVGNFLTDTNTISNQLTNPNYVSQNTPQLNLTEGLSSNLDGTPSYNGNSIDTDFSDSSSTGLFGNFSPTGAISNAAGSLAGMGIGQGINALGKLAGDSKGAQFATGIVGNTASNAAGTVVNNGFQNILNKTGSFLSGTGKTLGSAFTNLGSITSAGAGIGNMALDIFDPIKKSKGESIFNIAAGLGGSALGALGIPGVGPGVAFGLLAFNGIGHAFGSKLEDFTVDKDVMSRATTYGGFIDRVREGLRLAGGRYSFWNLPNRHKDEGTLAEAKREYDTWTDIDNENQWVQERAAGNLSIAQAEDRYRNAGGFSQLGVHSGKQGMSIKSKPTSFKIVQPTEEFKKGGAISSVTRFKIVSEVEEFKKGGTISNVTRIKLVKDIEEFKKGGAFNVIPEGALHARLHHMENDENITKKGIPVVSEKEGGEIEQQAEIEHSEIIFRLEVTKQLEELQQKYDSDEYTQKEKDEFALEAGKLLVHEILYNTDDRTNLINQNI